MRLSAVQAKRMAHAWIDEHLAMPTRVLVFTGKYRPDLAGRMFKVIVELEDPDDPFRYMILCAHDDGTIEVLRDRRIHYFKRMHRRGTRIPVSPHESLRHARMLDAFMAALHARTDDRPEWLIGLERCRNAAPNSSMDAQATVATSSGERLIALKVGVVCNGWLPAANERWARERVDIILREHATPDDMRRIAFHRIGEQRRARFPQ